MYQMLYKVTCHSFHDLVKAMEIHDIASPSKELLKKNLSLHEQLETERTENFPQVRQL